MSQQHVQLLSAARALAEVDARRPPAQPRFPQNHVSYRFIGEMAPSFVLLTDPDIDPEAPFSL